MKDAIICDIDGTLAKRVTDRSPYDMLRVNEDDVSVAVFSVVDAFIHCGVSVILLSGREESGRKLTEEWLAKYKIPYSVLYMRPTGDNRADNIVKKEIYEKHIKGKSEVLFVLDDRDRVVKMWRDEGLPCFQVAYGDF